MWTGTAEWHCPAMCGCALAITARWPQAPVGGVSYQHPVPRTITRVEIVNVCAAHDSLRTGPLPADPYYGARGYMDVPASPTEAERLYIALFRFGGQRLRLDTCGCALYVVTDRAGGNVSRRPHPRHTVKCAQHADDDDDHTDARDDNSRKNRLLDRAATLFGLDRDAITWRFEGRGRQRVFRVTLTGATPQQKATAQAWADANVGAGRVVVE